MASSRKRRRRRARRAALYAASLVTPRARLPWYKTRRGERKLKPLVTLPRIERWIDKRRKAERKRLADQKRFRPSNVLPRRVQRSQSDRVRRGERLIEREPRRKTRYPDCIDRPDSSVAASKRWEYHYDDLNLKKPGYGGYHPDQLKNRPATRYFRRFCK